MSWQALVVLAAMLTLNAAMLGIIAGVQHDDRLGGSAILLAVLAGAAYVMAAVAAWPA